MNLGRAILWCGVAFVGSGAAGYVFGFWEARPVINTLAILGAVAVAVATISVTAIAVVSLRSHSLHLSMGRFPVAPRIGLIWSGVAIVASINVGALLGFTIGLRTAQSGASILSGVGMVAMLVATVAVLAGITYKGELTTSEIDKDRNSRLSSGGRLISSINLLGAGHTGLRAP